MYNPKWRFMGLAEIKADHKINGEKTELLIVSLCPRDNGQFFLVVENETKQKSMPRLEKLFDTEDEGWKYIEELQENPKYALIHQPT